MLLPRKTIMCLAAVQLATDRGRVSSSKDINLTINLKLHNQAQYDAAVESLYDPKVADLPSLVY